MKYFRPIFCFVWLINFQVTAQPGWTIYNTSNSPIPENSVRCIAIDQSGTKWIGTDFGLASFDDVNWTIYQTVNSGIPDNSIRSLAIDDSNNVWIGTFAGGLAHFDGTTWTTFNTGNSDLPDDFVRSLAVDTLNNLWIGTIGGLAYFNGLNWDVYNTSNSVLISNNIASLYVDSGTNGVVIGTINGGLVYYDSMGWDHYSIWNSNLPDNTLLGIDKDSSGVVWLATPAAGLSAHIGGFSFLTLNTASSSIATNSLTGISIAPDESIWASCVDSGIIKKEGLDFVCYNTNNSPMPDNYTQAVLVDDNGIVWIGTQQEGLVRLDESLYLHTPELSNKVAVNIFPVPADDYVTIKSDTENAFQLFIYNISGELMNTYNTKSNSETFIIETTFWKSGTYLVNVFEETDLLVSKILIVSH